jgi:Bacterial regulatory proteins, tetR family
MNMSSNEIKKAALFHFAHSGYDGTALSVIAGEVGIKKQSIYAHFANKDELFLIILDEVLTNEKTYIHDFFKNNHSLYLKLKLYEFLQGYSERYTMHANTKFLLRIGFLPPSHLHHQVMDSLYRFYDEMEEILIEVFEKNSDSITTPVNECAIAFIGLFDSVLVELLYSGNERFYRRLHACWEIFWKGISRNVEAP